jgi:large subunit ribosomal protein L4e
MKIPILNLEGDKKSEISSEIFDGRIRKDILQKVTETEKMRSPYAPYFLAGKQASAAGKIRHGRRRWKTAAGKGISRVPRKIFWRRGTQFYWVAATISGVRKGRRAHPPKILGMINTKKINKKEKRLALLSALALSASNEEVKKKYKTLENKEIKIKLPIVVEDKITNLKTKDLLISLQKILGDLYGLSIRSKEVRAGRGKMRGRKYKKTRGLLLVTGEKDNKRVNCIEAKSSNEIMISDLAGNGARIIIYTENAVKALEKRISGQKEEKKEPVKKETKQVKNKSVKKKE